MSAWGGAWGASWGGAWGYSTYMPSYRAAVRLRSPIATTLQLQSLVG